MILLKMLAFAKNTSRSIFLSIKYGIFHEFKVERIWTNVQKMGFSAIFAKMPILQLCCHYYVHFFEQEEKKEETSYR